MQLPNHLASMRVCTYAYVSTAVRVCVCIFFCLSVVVSMYALGVCISNNYCVDVSIVCCFFTLFIVGRTSTAPLMTVSRGLELLLQQRAGCQYLLEGEICCLQYIVVTEMHLVTVFLFHSYISCVVGCPYEGKISPEAVAKVSRKQFLVAWERSLSLSYGL